MDLLYITVYLILIVEFTMRVTEEENNESNRRRKQLFERA